MSTIYTMYVITDLVNIRLDMERETLLQSTKHKFLTSIHTKTIIVAAVRGK